MSGEGHDTWRPFENIVTKVADDIDILGHDEVVFKTDKEMPLASVQARVRRLTRKPMVPINAPRGESQSNGAIENAVQRFEGIFRSMRLDLEEKMGKQIPFHHPIIHWMVDAVAELHNRFRGADGQFKTPL